MGLDMYLIKKVWLSDYNPSTKDKKDKIKKIFNSGFEPEEVSFEVGYWRKANAIHNWFVQNVQEGEDDCGTYGVSVEQLIQLKEVCEKILKTKDDEKEFEKVKEKLSTASGFFFGHTEYDDYYFKQLEHTISIVNKILKHEMTEQLGKGKSYFGSYYYHSSW